MAKKNFGKLFAFAAIAGAAVGAVTYCLRYKSFHKELDEDFHDFEDEFEDFHDDTDKSASAARNYVSLNPDRPAEKAENADMEAVQEKTAGEPTSLNNTESIVSISSEAEEKSADEISDASCSTTIVEDMTE